MPSDPCYCGKTTTDLEAQPIGIQRDMDGNPAAILFQCDDCRTTRAVMWEDEPRGDSWLLHTRAVLVEAERMRAAV